MYEKAAKEEKGTKNKKEDKEDVKEGEVVDED
jgi:hypothetical protein